MTFKTVRAEIREFERAGKSAKFRLIFIEESSSDYGSSIPPEREEIGNYQLLLTEQKKKFSLQRCDTPTKSEIDLLVDREPNSVVLFFRLGRHNTYGDRIFINILYGWLGGWKSIRFDTSDWWGFFKEEF